MPPAADDPRTTSALAAHQAGALRWLGGGVIAVVLGVLLGVAAVTIAGSTGRRLPAVGLVVVALVAAGLAAAVAGAGGLLRSLRWRRALQETGWRTGRLRIAGPAVVAFEPDGYDELDPVDERGRGVAPVQLRLLSTAIWRTRAVQALDGAEVRAAPVGPAEWVLTADGIDTLFGARTVRRRD
ncbi:hypothetical protein OF117_09785 [Geodermatophilus sp. YIM 151500]|uniref:hypothetical protein n=1 Tax=Geodermatophilus sp. YIM 151500 TaxID=2984531 RepID=UPI0021E3E069|nr:hypothetical protein [Geodermatophilus sp. YIM 151500]MCV2489655.1 hypothetical protein [Geodermatophilus sp. YIM 151500]